MSSCMCALPPPTDQEYREHNRRTEEARQKWEKDTYFCCTVCGCVLVWQIACMVLTSDLYHLTSDLYHLTSDLYHLTSDLQTLEKLEVERLNYMKEAVDKYAETLKLLVPVIQSVSRWMCARLHSLHAQAGICCVLWSTLIRAARRSLHLPAAWRPWRMWPVLVPPTVQPPTVQSSCCTRPM